MCSANPGPTDTRFNFPFFGECRMRAGTPAFPVENSESGRCTERSIRVSSTTATATPFNVVFGTSNLPRELAMRAHGSHTPSNPTDDCTHAEGLLTHSR